MLFAMESGSHSADVRMQLSVNGQTLKIGQLGPEFIILDDPIDLPPCEAEITMSVDGRERRWAVWLVNGISTGEPRVEISALPSS